VAIYTNSVFKIQFANAFSIDAVTYVCQLIGPVNQSGNCVNANFLLSISNVINAYVNDGMIILTISNFLTPDTVGDYTGTSVEIYTAENNLIMSSKDDVNNGQVAISVFT